MKKINKISTILLAIALLGFYGCGKKMSAGHGHGHDHGHGGGDENAKITKLTYEQIEAVGVEFGEVEYKALDATVKANGILRVPNNKKANITSLYGGVVKALKVQLGDRVRKGQVIATLANPEFVQLQENYLVAKSQINLAKQEFERQQKLHTENIGSLKNLQNAKSQLNTLLAQVESLERRIKLMGVDVNSVARGNVKSVLFVRSPLSGTVSKLVAQIGSFVDASAPIGEIVDNSSLHLDLQVFEKDLNLISVGQTIHFTLTNNPVNEYDAKIYSIGSSFEDVSKTIPVHAKVMGDKDDLFDGMNVTAVVSLSNETSPTVPNDAIVSANGKDYIFIVTNEEAEEHNHEEGEEHNHEGHNHDNENAHAGHDHGNHEGHNHEGGEEHNHEGHNHDNENAHAGHDHDNHEGHNHESGEEHNHEGHSHEAEGLNFAKIQVVKGVSSMGYTAVTFVEEIPEDAEIVVKKAFFINAKMSGSAGHGHSH